MKKTMTLFVFLLLFSHNVWACEPCARDITPLEDIIAKSDLIVIGQRYNPPWFFDDNYSKPPPSNIKVRVERILKGKLNKKIITVNSWNGMCPHGVVLFKEKTLLLLKKASSDRYHTVDPVCGINQYTIINSYLTRKEYRGVKTHNEPLMSVDEFVERYL